MNVSLSPQKTPHSSPVSSLWDIWRKLTALYRNRTRAAYRYAIHIENRYFRFEWFIVSEISVSIKLSKGKYFDILVTFQLSSSQNQHLVLIFAQQHKKCSNYNTLDDNRIIIVHEIKKMDYTSSRVASKFSFHQDRGYINHMARSWSTSNGTFSDLYCGGALSRFRDYSHMNIPWIQRFWPVQISLLKLMSKCLQSMLPTSHLKRISSVFHLASPPWYVCTHPPTWVGHIYEHLTA